MHAGVGAGAGAAAGTTWSGTRSPHLLWVNHFAVTPGEGGTTRHFEVGRELVRAGWRVTLCASDFTYQQRRYARRDGAGVRRPIEESMEGVQLAWLWAAAYERNDWRRAWNWLSFGGSLLRWGRHADRPDVVIGSSPSLFAALAAERLARRWGVPFVLEVRDLWPESLLAVGARRGPGYVALSGIARYLYRRADRVIVLARGTADHLQRRGVSRSKIHFVPNGADVEAFEPRDKLARDRQQETVTFAYTGAHGPANGLDVVLDAAERLKGQQFPRTEPDGANNQPFLQAEPQRVRFLLVGDGPAKDELLAEARRRGLDNVEFRDPVPKVDVADVLAEADAGLMVLRDARLFTYGVSPNKLFDYFAAGLPVVCNVPGEVAAMVEAAGAGELAPPGSVDGLVAAIQRVVEFGPERRAEMGDAGREWVARERSRSVLAAQLEDVLRPLIAP